MFASRMLIRVPGQSLYSKTQIRGFGLTCAVLDPAKKVTTPAPPPPSKHTTKKAAPPEPEKPAPRKRLVLSDQQRSVKEVKAKARLLTANEAKEQEREKVKKAKEKKAAKIKAQKEKEKEKEALKEILKKPYPPPPKRPLTGYIQFFMDIHGTVQGESVTDRAVATSERWKALSEAERQEYSKKAASSRVQYNSDLADWIASLNAAQLRAARLNKEPGTRLTAALDQLPRRPPNGYALFFAEYVKRPEIASKVEEIGKKLGGGDPSSVTRQTAGARGRVVGEQWNKMSDKEKQVYTDRSTQLKKEYQASYGDLIAQQQKAAERAATL